MYTVPKLSLTVPKQLSSSQFIVSILQPLSGCFCHQIHQQKLGTKLTVQNKYRNIEVEISR